ncbi:unnamed protein product [Cylicostephanus goldi]|uniref:Saposin B-type domain-containing protein n=1 Tax=Cylicostephanus goldi TaxID=71465 RepID=A0A3P6RK56_CYLGO|nr:unnamed protein product [Cylicostephanus goldi]
MKVILLLSLVLCVAFAYVTRVAEDNDKPPFCDVCLNLVKELKEALKGGKQLKEVAHKFCSEKMPDYLIAVCHIEVDRYWKKIMELIEVGFSKYAKKPSKKTTFTLLKR